MNKFIVNKYQNIFTILKRIELKKKKKKYSFQIIQFTVGLRIQT